MMLKALLIKYFTHAQRAFNQLFRVPFLHIISKQLESNANTNTEVKTNKKRINTEETKTIFMKKKT